MKIFGRIIPWILATSCVTVVGCDNTKETVNAQPLSKAIVSISIELTDSKSPDAPVSGKCRDCNGTGIVGDGRIQVKCETCNGTGKITMSEFDWKGFVTSMKE